MKKIIITTVLGAMLATGAVDGDNRSGLYVGLGYGKANYADDGLSEQLSHGSEVEDSNNGPKAYIGYQFNNVIGIELGYADYGKYEAKTSGNDYSYAAKSYSLSANLGYSFMDSQLRPFVNLGAAYLSTKHENLYRTFEDTTNDTGLGFHYGLGIQYEPNALKGVGFRVAYEIDSYATAIKTVGTHSDFDKTYTQANSLLYAAVQYKF